MLKLIHTADIHFGVDSPIYIGDKSFYDIQKEKFLYLINKAKTKGIKYIVIAGDLFDSNNVYDSIVKEVYEIMRKNSEITFIIIPGGGSFKDNKIVGHDSYDEAFSIYKREPFSFPSENIKILTNKKSIYEEDNIIFYSSWFKIPYFNLKDSKINILISHIGISQDGDISKEEFIERTKNFDYIALGHYHSFNKISDRAYYSGSLVQFKGSSSQKKKIPSGFIIVEIDDNKNLNVIYEEFNDIPQIYNYPIVYNNQMIEEIEQKLENGNIVFIENYLEKLKDDISKLKHRFDNNLRGKLQSLNINNDIINILEEILDQYENTITEFNREYIDLEDFHITKEDILDFLIYDFAYLTSQEELKESVLKNKIIDYLIKKFEEIGYSNEGKD